MAGEVVDAALVCNNVRCRIDLFLEIGMMWSHVTRSTGNDRTSPPGVDAQRNQTFLLVLSRLAANRPHCVVPNKASSQIHKRARSTRPSSALKCPRHYQNASVAARFHPSLWPKRSAAVGGSPIAQKSFLHTNQQITPIFPAPALHSPPHVMYSRAVRVGRIYGVPATKPLSARASVRDNVIQ